MYPNNNPVLKQNDDIIKVIKKNLVEIRTSIEDGENSELKVFNKYLSNKEIIGLGEATHGTKEFQNMRTRIILYLIKNLGFKSIVLEESYSHCLKINSYILGGEGTAEDVVCEGLYFPWVFKTKETVELVKLLREYNKNVHENDKVRFYGMDMQGSEEAINVLKDYIEKVDFENYSRLRNDFDFLKNELNKNRFEDLLQRIDNIDNMLIKNKIKCLGNSSEIKYNEIYHCIEMYKQWIEFNQNMTFNKRDRFMFENAKWIVENTKKFNGGKVIIIGHNDHISKGIVPNNSSEKQLGRWLYETYNDMFYNIGFEFSRGNFYSMDMNTRELKVYKVDKTVTNDLAARLFEKADVPMFYLDLNVEAHTNLSFKNFICTINRYNSIGAIYDDKSYEFGVDSIIIKDMYDGILYIRDSKNTTLLKSI